jgi:brefeldin A-resistance guanine nucleotide exchange factor 1
MLLSVSDPTRQSVPATVENIADAVTHARFVGTDQANDGVVLMKILQVVAFKFKNNYGCIIYSIR